MDILKKIFTIIAAASTVIMLIASNSFADENIESSMFVTPMRQQILLNPGQKYNGEVQVYNSANATSNLKFKVEIGSYNITSEKSDIDSYGGIDVVNKTKYNSIMDWISVDIDSGEVKPNENINVHYTIDVPFDAPGGAQYASILIINDTVSEEARKDGINIKNKLQAASAIIANVSGKSIEKGSISENNVPSFLSSGPLEATSMVRNEGNIYTDAEYTLQVWPVFNDEELCTNEEKPDSSLILPDTERYHSQTCNLPTIGIFKAKQVVKIFGETSINEKMVIKCPIWLLFIIIFAIAAIIIYFIAKARKRNIKKETA